MAPHPVIVAAKRTPVGRFFGSLAKTPAPKLGSYAIDAVFQDAPAIKDHVDEVIMGCVLQAGVGQNPARQAGLGAGLPNTLSAVTVNKVCGSGLEAVMMAAQSIKAGDNECVVAGGFENMTAAPHYAYLRGGAKFGEVKFQDHMQQDGLSCAFESWGMTSAADHIAAKYDVSREDQDHFSARSHKLAHAASDAGYFDAELVALTGEQIGNRKNPGPDGGLAHDEGVRPETDPEVLAKLRTVPGHECITAGNSSQISDGAAAIAVLSEFKAAELGLTPMAKIVSYATSGVEPKDIFEAPITGITKALDKAGLGISDIDLFEINEAFAAQVLCNVKVLGIPDEKLNICGGGIAIGHPIGASGARVLTTLLHQMKRTGAKRGLAALCLGGGNSVAMVVEA